MEESAVDEDECLRPERDLFSVVVSCSPERVLEGETGEGGEFAMDDLGEFRADKENELSLRYLGILTAGVATSAGPSTPVLTMDFWVVILSPGTDLGLSAFAFSVLGTERFALA